MNTVLTFLGLTVALFGVCQGQKSDIDLATYGVTAISSASCPPADNITAPGYFIDRQFDAKCFSRQVECNADGTPGNNVRVCTGGKMFTQDGESATCQTAEAASGTCGITIGCGLDGIWVYVDDTAIWQQTAADLQFGDLPHTDTDNNEKCSINHDDNNNRYEGFMSFDSADDGPTVAACAPGAVTVAADATSEDGIHIQYKFMVKRRSDRASRVGGEDANTDERVEEEHGAVVTREKCFMVDAQCNYNPDGTATASYSPSSPNALDEHDDSTLNFDLVPVDCNDVSNVLTEEKEVYVGVETDVCFAARIIDDTTWHEGIKLHASTCWASSSSDPGVTTNKYELTQDLTFEWTCDLPINGETAQNTDRLIDTFKFEAFRFQNGNKADMNSDTSYVQQIYIHCDVNACADTDITSAGCVPHSQCGGNNRKRRAADVNSMLPKLTKQQIKTSMFVLPKAQSNFETQQPQYRLLSDALSLGIFAVGCVFAVVAMGLFIVLKKTNRKLKYKMLNENL